MLNWSPETQLSKMNIIDWFLHFFWHNHWEQLPGVAYVSAVCDPGQPIPITSMEDYSLDTISVRRYGGDAYGNGGENSQFGAPAMWQAVF